MGLGFVKYMKMEYEDEKPDAKLKLHVFKWNMNEELKGFTFHLSFLFSYLSYRIKTRKHSFFFSTTNSQSSYPISIVFRKAKSLHIFNVKLSVSNSIMLFFFWADVSIREKIKKMKYTNIFNWNDMNMGNECK